MFCVHRSNISHKSNYVMSNELCSNETHEQVSAQTIQRLNIGFYLTGIKRETHEILSIFQNVFLFMPPCDGKRMLRLSQVFLLSHWFHTFLGKTNNIFRLPSGSRNFPANRPSCFAFSIPTF